MCVSLKPERLDGFDSYSAFKNSSVVSIFAVNTNILAPKLGALEVDPTIQNGDFIENGCNEFA
jgi:hypothetical protein